MLVTTVTNTTTETELKGIKIAAIIGDNCPVIAKYIPTILYKNDTIKLALITAIVCFANCKKLGSFLN